MGGTPSGASGWGVSVPLSGLTSVNFINRKKGLKYIPMCFRPLIGVNFCKRNTYRDVMIGADGFRPLIGVNFCKQ